MNTVSSEKPLQPTSVLLVEDDAPTSWRLQDALGKAGYQVRAAGTLGEARAALAESTPKVLLTDLQLPDGHGVDLIRETRARFPETEIMVISILGDEESVISAITLIIDNAKIGFFKTDVQPNVTGFLQPLQPFRPISSGQGIEADQNQLSKSDTTRPAQLFDHPLEADGVASYADAEEVLAKLPRRGIPIIFRDLKDGERQAVRIQHHAAHRSARA